MATLEQVELELAALAHRLWCEQMIARGWRPGPYSPDTHTHDALVAFERLSAVDKHNTFIGVASLELAERLLSVVEYPRGDDREFGVEELAVGMRVGFADEPGSLGTVVAWKEDPKWPGCLQTITVQWDSGERNVHAAAERELLRLNTVA